MQIAIPDGGQRFGFPEAAFVGLVRGVIMRMHDNRFGAIDDAVTLSAAPAGVLVILGVLHFLETTPVAPDIFAQTAADHAEEVLPLRGLTLRAEAALIIVGVNGPAIRPGNLAAEDRGGPLILQRPDQRPQPTR